MSAEQFACTYMQQTLALAAEALAAGELSLASFPPSWVGCCAGESVCLFEQYVLSQPAGSMHDWAKTLARF